MSAADGLDLPPHVARSASFNGLVYQIREPRHGVVVEVGQDFVAVTIAGLLVFRITQVPVVDLLDRRRKLEGG